MKEINVPNWDDNADKNPLLANIPAGERKVIAEVFRLAKEISDSGIIELSIMGEDGGEKTTSIYVPDNCPALVITVTSTARWGYC